MLIRDIENSEYFKALDKTRLCELLHPQKESNDLKLPYSLAHAIVKPGEKSQHHRLKTSSELYYILEGNGIMFIDDDSEKIHSGQAIFIPPNSKQHIQNTGISDLKFLCIVSPPWKKEDDEVG